MNRRRSIALVAVVVLAPAATAACSASRDAPAARVGYCQGVDADHREGDRVEIAFTRGAETLGEVGVPVTGAAAVPVTPGDVVVLVDGVDVAHMTTTDGTTVYAHSGTGCPAALG